MEVADLIILENSAFLNNSGSATYPQYKYLSNIILNISMIFDRNCNNSRQLFLYQEWFYDTGPFGGDVRSYESFYKFNVLEYVKIPIGRPAYQCSSPYSSYPTYFSLCNQQPNQPCKCIMQPTLFITINPPAYICYEYSFNYEYSRSSHYTKTITYTSNGGSSNDWSIPSGLSTTPVRPTNY